MNRHVASIIALEPDDFFDEVGLAAATFILRLADEYSTDQESTFENLWLKTWRSKRCQFETNQMDDPLTNALNHLDGKLAEAALKRLQKHKPVAGDGIPREVKSYFDAIVWKTERHLGRVMLVTQLHYLFIIDRDWTLKHLINPLHNVKSIEGVDLWSAFGWSPRLDWELFRTLKSPFLNIISNSDHNITTIKRLRRLFVAVCMDMPKALPEKEILKVSREISHQGLATLIQGLTRRFEDKSKDRKRIWKENIHPWLHDFWPKASSLNTSKTSEAFLSMLVNSGDAFPDAAKWLIEYLRPSKGNSLYDLKRNGYAKKYPVEMLEILDKIIDDSTLDTYNRSHLKCLLDELIASKRDISNSQIYQRLYRISSS